MDKRGSTNGNDVASHGSAPGGVYPKKDIEAKLWEEFARALTIKGQFSALSSLAALPPASAKLRIIHWHVRTHIQELIRVVDEDDPALTPWRLLLGEIQRQWRPLVSPQEVREDILPWEDLTVKMNL